MGSANTIHVPCPKCQNLVPIQSKAGSCMMEDLPINQANLAELQDVVEADIVCMNCGSELIVKVQPLIAVEMNNIDRMEKLN